MTTWQVFRWPAAVAALTLTGLLAGLVSDGWGDAVAALGLLVPALLALMFGWRRHRQDRP